VKPDLAELLASARYVSLPLTVPFRGITQRELVLLEGKLGWSEFSPFVEYSDRESSAWLAAACDFGWNALPSLQRETIGINATIPAVDLAEVHRLLELFHGCRTFKIKVAEPGQGRQEDIERVRFVRESVGPEGRIRLDANGAWNVDEAEHAIHEFAPFDIEYVEQPCASVAELHELRERIAYMDIPIAADESIRKAEDPAAIIAAGAADILVLKAQPLGGVHRVRELAVETHLPIVLSSALESSIGIGMGLAAACALPTLDFDCGLGTATLLAADVVSTPLVAHNGQMTMQRLTPDEALLEAYTMSPERALWWRERLARCWELLEA
jgi:O-succinylbenzoate synthase